MSDKNDAIFYIGQEVEGIFYRAVESGLSFDEVMAELRFKLSEIEENRDDYEGAA